MTHKGRILVVDDQTNARTALSELLRGAGFDVEMAADAFKALGKYAVFGPHVVITDLRMPGMSGIELVARIRALEDPASVIVMTAFGTVETAIEAIRAGASEYVTKPLNFDELLVMIDKVLESQALRREADRLRQRMRERLAPNNLIGNSPPMRRVFDIVDQVAASKATVLVCGESGTGKELVASAIHDRSPRAQAPFVRVHCAALAETLLESELFGHERGAFTGANQRKDGRFQLAHGGTLFLDEIGEISPSVQVKLLRFLQEHELERVGGTQTIHVDVRVIAATNRNLRDEVARGRFREDLYYRLKVVELTMPRLRDRPTDIASLAHHFLERFARENGKTIVGFSPECLELLAAHDWPGNVRELENAVESAVVLTPLSVIEPHSLPRDLRSKELARSACPAIPGSKLADIERYAILETLAAVGGSTSKAAEVLGISSRTIQYRLHQYSAAPHSEIAVVRVADYATNGETSASKV
jgi:DNA-binding NtrC family response regulator